MEGFGIKNLRAVAFLGHSGSGKTSLIDSILHKTGANTRLGSVNSGSSMCDYNDVEIEHKITISAKLLNAKWKNKLIYLADTPGYADFIIEVHSTLVAVDAAVLVVDGVAGIEVGTDRMWSILNEYEMPRFICINKLDKENSDFTKTLQALQEAYGKSCAPLYYPVGKQSGFTQVVNLMTKDGLEKLDDDDKKTAEKLRENLIDAIAEADDKLLEKYLGGEELSQEEIVNAVHAAVAAGKLFPVICSSAVKEIGTSELIDSLADFAPSPSESAPIPVKEAGKEEERTVPISEDAPFGAFVFKSISDPYVGQLSIFRVMSGKIASNTEFFNVTKQHKEKIGQLYILQGKTQSPVASLSAGDIGCVAKLKDTAMSDSLTNEKQQFIYRALKKLEPAISFSLKPKTRQDEEKISQALHKLVAEDPAFQVGRDPQTKELIISGMGDMHLEIMIQKLKNRYKVEVEVGVPKVPYKETIKKKIQIILSP